MTEPTKICSKCSEIKAIQEFSLQKKINKYRAFCKVCEAAWNKAYRERNKEKIARDYKKWREQNPEKMKAAKDRWNQANQEHLKEWQRAYNQRTTKRRAENWLIWYSNNKNRISAKNQDKWNNPAIRELLLEKGRKYKRENSDKLKHYAHIRRALLYENGFFYISPKDNKKLSASICAYCGVTNQIEIDHIIPISRGGTHGIGNLILACRACNASKGARTIMEWRIWKMRIAKFQNQGGSDS